MSLRALHIGDLHFWRYPMNPLRYAGKRMLGVGNLALKRGRVFRQKHGAILAERLAELDADWALFSGDFSTTSLRSEFLAARQALAPLEAAMSGRILAVPGNHDRYTRAEIRRRTFDKVMGDWCGDGWPWFRHLGEGVWATGLDAATSNGLGCFGRVTDPMMKALEKWAEEHGDAAEELWVLCHFPAEDLPGIYHSDRGEELREGARLRKFLGDLGKDVFYLHGHHHYRWAYRSPSMPRVTYLNAGAPLLHHAGTPDSDLGFLELERRNGTTNVRVHRCDIAEGRKWEMQDVRIPASGEHVDLQHPERAPR